MANLVWETMGLYGLKGKVYDREHQDFSTDSKDFLQVLGFMMDNATSNDTLLEALGHLHHKDGLSFNTTHSRLRCMPHTIHLSALEVRWLISFIQCILTEYPSSALGRCWNL
jgi:hypothetical protein